MYALRARITSLQPAVVDLSSDDYVASSNNNDDFLLIHFPSDTLVLLILAPDKVDYNICTTDSINCYKFITRKNSSTIKEVLLVLKSIPLNSWYKIIPLSLFVQQPNSLAQGGKATSIRQL